MGWILFAPLYLLHMSGSGSINSINPMKCDSDWDYSSQAPNHSPLPSMNISNQLLFHLSVNSLQLQVAISMTFSHLSMSVLPETTPSYIYISNTQNPLIEQELLEDDQMIYSVKVEFLPKAVTLLKIFRIFRIVGYGIENPVILQSWYKLFTNDWTLKLLMNHCAFCLK